MENNENIKPRPVTFKNLSIVTKNVEDTVKSVDKITFAVKRENKKEVLFPDSSFDKISIKHGVTVILAKDIEEDYTKIKDLNALILLDKAKPNLIAGFIPPLFIEYIDVHNKSIKTHVNINDMVIVKKKFIGKKLNLPKQVKSFYLKSLNNITVVIAVLDDGDFFLSNQLEKI